MNAESNRLPVLAAEINAAIKGLKAAAETAFGHAIVVGERLIEVKDLAGHGNWLPWLNEHCHLSDRQAQKYMRLARAKEALAAKAPLTADLTIEGAIAALAVAKPVSYLPPAGFLKIGRNHSLAKLPVSFVLAPSYQHPRFFFVTRVSDREIVGGRRPMRHDYVEAMLAAMDSSFADFDWQDVPSAPWAFNDLLFNSPSAYLNSLRLQNDEDDLAELISLSDGSEPVEFGVYLKRSICGEASA